MTDIDLGHRPKLFGWKFARLAVVATSLSAVFAFGVLGEGDASAAYVGESLMQVSDVVGGWQGEKYRNWLQIEAHYWGTGGGGTFGAAGGRGAAGAGAGGAAAVARTGAATARPAPRGRNYFSGPGGPQKGPGQLVIAVDKHSPGLAQMMAKCTSKAAIPELQFAESATLNRPLTEMGPKPAAIPDYFEYRLKDVQFSDCPVVDGAPEQAIVISFKDVERLNYQGSGEPVTMTPAMLQPLKTTGVTKSFVLSWFAVAHDVADDQCAKLNAKPTEDDYYALMSKEDADKERADLVARKTAVNYENGQMSRRGPHRLDATLLPGIVKDPGHVIPQTKFARGINLDGNDGTGRPPAGVCRHRNYVSQDGRQTGIDNQLFTVQGCAAGYQGHKGFLLQYRNEQRRNGQVSVLIQISGIDNDRNDNDIQVTILHSRDAPAKNSDGSKILADYTFRLTNDPSFNYYVTRLRGRIVNGVIMTDQVPLLRMYESTELLLHNAALRLEIMPDGNLKGVVAGYEDWRRIMMHDTNSNSESLFGLQAPGMYNAFKREADGMKNPVTGRCDGISEAYDIEASPAFIPPGQIRTLVADASSQTRKAR